jgi:hypothetical protein
MDRAALIRLLGTIFETRETELVCSEFFELLPAYVDLVASSGEAGAAQSEFPQVAQHIAQCLECGEEYQALLEVTRPPQ